MRTFMPVLLLLASCAADPAPREDVARLQEELRDASRRHAETVAALDDLKAEIRELRKRPAPPSEPPPAPAIPAPLPLPAGFTGGVGGSAPGLNDLFWVLSRTSEAGEDRLVLALYRSAPSGLTLEAVRRLNQDLRIIDFQNAKPRVKDVLKELDRK